MKALLSVSAALFLTAGLLAQEIPDPLEAARTAKAARDKHAQLKADGAALRQKISDMESSLQSAKEAAVDLAGKEQTAAKIMAATDKATEDVFSAFATRLGEMEAALASVKAASADLAGKEATATKASEASGRAADEVTGILAARLLAARRVLAPDAKPGQQQNRAAPAPPVFTAQKEPAESKTPAPKTLAKKTDAKPAPATVIVVTEPDAKLEFNGRATTSTGARRVFTTAVLAVDQSYDCELLVTLANGKKIKRQVSVEAGAELTVDAK